MNSVNLRIIIMFVPVHDDLMKEVEKIRDLLEDTYVISGLTNN